MKIILGRFGHNHSLANVDCVCTHLNGQRNPADHAACMCAKDDAVEEASTAPASLVVRFRFS